MKIWTVTTDNNGGQTSICMTQADADALAVKIVTAWFDGHVAADGEPRDHTDWKESYSILCDTCGFMDCIAVEEHDISGHPATVQADGALNNCLDQLHLLADLANCRDEDVENAILDANTALDMLAGNDPAEDEPDAAQLHQIEQDRITTEFHASGLSARDYWQRVKNERASEIAGFAASIPDTEASDALTEAWLDKPAAKPVITLDNIRDQLRARWSANLPVVDAIQERAVLDPEYAADVALWLTGEKSTVHLRDRIVEPIRQLPHIVAIGKQFNPSTEWHNTWVPLDTAAHLARNSFTDTAASDALTEAGYYEGPWTEAALTELPGDDMDRMCPECGMTCEC